MEKSRTKKQIHKEKILNKARSQKEKIPDQLLRLIRISDIILEVVDSRFAEEMRNKEIEKIIQDSKKKLIIVLTKNDLRNKEKEIPDSIFVSSKTGKGISRLRNQIKIEAKKVKESEDKTDNKIHVGIIGYPNTGKSSLINCLIGKKSARTSSESGFTKGLQKLRLSSGILLIDSPGIIPKKEYSTTNKEKISQQGKFSARSYSKIKNPEIAVHNILKEYTKEIEEHYKIQTNGNSEILLEEIGKQKRFLKKGGEIDEDRTARFILKEWQEGDIKV